MSGLIAARIPAPLRPGTMTVAYSVVLASGFLALLGAGPLLDRIGPEPVFGAVAGAQTAAAVLVGRIAVRGPPAAQSST